MILYARIGGNPSGKTSRKLERASTSASMPKGKKGKKKKPNAKGLSVGKSTPGFSAQRKERIPFKIFL